MARQEHRRQVVLLPLAVLAALSLTLALSLRHEAPPAAAVGENSLTFPDSADITGKESSMMLDANGFPVVAYTAEAATRQIRLLHCNDANCAGGDESVETVFASSSLPFSPSLSLDTAGNPIITFSHFGINVLHCNDANCAGNDESLVTHLAGIVIGEAAHVLAPGDLPLVVFYRSGADGLRLLRCANTNCTTLSNDPAFVVQTGANDGFSLALDASGFPVVSYRDEGVGGGLELLHCNDLNCTGADESVVSLDLAHSGKFTSMALVNGNPVIAYASGSAPDDVTVARCDDPNCVGGGETIQVLTSDCCQNSRSADLAIDGNGNPVVAYYRGASLETRVIHCNDPACSGADESDVSAATVGGQATSAPPSLVLDANGIPVVSLYKASGNDLAILHCGDANCSVPAPPTPTNTVPPTDTPPATSTATSTPPATSTPTNTPVVPTATATDTHTNTPVPPTATSTSTPTNTPVPPTATSTSTPTNTPVPPTATPTNSPTNTPVPPTATPTNSPTNTPVPPAATSTNTPTNTPVNTATNTPTNTPLPPTATSTNTATNTSVPPTATSTNTPTNTPAPPIATQTNTPTSTATNTPVPTATNSPRPTSTAQNATRTVAATFTPPGPKCADVNGDGRVNSGDILRVLIQAFRPYDARYDINRDGKVDFRDIVAVARQWGRKC